MKTEINDHYDAKYYLHTGYKRSSAFEHPAIGCIASSQLALPDDDMPGFVTIDAGYDRTDGGRFYRSVPAYLGPQHAPLAVHDPFEGLDFDLTRPEFQPFDAESMLAALDVMQDRVATLVEGKAKRAEAEASGKQKPLSEADLALAEGVHEFARLLLAYARKNLQVRHG